MNTFSGALFLLLVALVAALPQQAQEPKPVPPKPEATVVVVDEKEALGKPRKVIFTPEQIKLLSADPALADRSGIRLIHGALYTVVGGRLVPLPGGGASGCLDMNGEAMQAKIAAAQAELVKQVASETPERK